MKTLFKKKIINPERVIESARSTWHAYFSQIYYNPITGTTKKLAFWYNGDRKYEVTYGNETLYQGPILEEAIEAWESA